MKGIHIFLADGFEDMEAICTIDVLRRGSLDVKTVSISGSPQVTSSHGITVKADMTYEELTAGMASAEAGPSDAEAIYTAAKRIIDSRFAEPLTIKDIADECHVSVSYLHRVFAKAAGRSPHLTLIERRIIEAQILLADTSLPVGEIAARCGFYSQSHFNECFKKKTGNTPNEFRRSNRYTI